MILYDTFSVNISIKNSKENKKRSATLISSKECITRARREASSSKDYIVEQCIDKYRSFKNENCLINDKHITCSNDDVKENLDPIRSKTHNDTFNNSNLMNDTDNTMIPNDYVCENDNEKQFISNDINLSTFNPKIYNMNTDNVTDDIQSVCNQISRTNFENVQQISLSNIIPKSKEGIANNDRSFCKKIDKIEYSVDDLNVVNTNKSVERVSQNDITSFTNKYVDDNREIRYDCIDNHSGLLNDKRFNNTDIIIPKEQDRDSIHIAKVTRDKYNILNKQIDKHNAESSIQCIAFYENYKSKNNIKSNVKSCFKISIDLCKIQNLIDTKPKLFIKQNHNDNNQQHKNINYL